jgi:hypothetical protein
MGPDQWTEHFCLVNLGCQVETEDEAAKRAAEDLIAADESRMQGGGTDAEFALSLKSKGYLIVDGFKRARD